MSSYVREDWVLFTNLNTLGQKAGVPARALRRLVVKELADNALDAGFKVDVALTEGWYVVTDDGPGLPLRPGYETQDVAELFSVRRPLMSGKLRRPSRGALGNGLRVVTGAVTATDGQLIVQTKGMRYELRPMDDGSSMVVASSPTPDMRTQISVRLGPALPSDGEGDLQWARFAMSIGPQHYRGNTSCWWYDSNSFFDLVRSAGNMPLKSLIAEFDGFKKQMSALGEDDTDALEWGTCGGCTREVADSLLTLMRTVESTRKKPNVLVNKDSAGHSRVMGEIEVLPGRGAHSAFLPFVIDVFAQESSYDGVTMMVNGTPVTGDISVWRDGKTTIVIHGAGLHHRIDKVTRANFKVAINITIPYMPITTDGKEPDTRRFLDPMSEAIRKATRKFKAEKQAAKGATRQNEIIESVVPDCVEIGTDGGRLPLSLRQLFYLVRPHVLDAELDIDYNYFSRVITAYEAKYGEIDGMYRDPRGTLIHPHTREVIQLGTINVRAYKRPDWLIRNVLYCEKEGLFPLLHAAKWAEKNDCALLSSKGMASRAARDVIDLLGDGDEDLNFFCIHDADAAGGMIFQTLQGATLARGARRVKIVNLGLEPWEAVDLGLQVETFKPKNEAKPSAVADYVKDRSGRDWQRWLQTHRVELNALKPEAFLAWLDDKFAPHRGKKLVPPTRVVQQSMESAIREQKKQQLLEQLMRDNDFDALLERECRMADSYLSPDEIQRRLARKPELSWRDIIAQEAATR